MRIFVWALYALSGWHLAQGNMDSAEFAVQMAVLLEIKNLLHRQLKDRSNKCTIPLHDQHVEAMPRS